MAKLPSTTAFFVYLVTSTFYEVSLQKLNPSFHSSIFMQSIEEWDDDGLSD